jgi:hypothetical protein
VFWLSPVVFAAVLESTTTPYPGVTYSTYVESGIPARIHVIELDLTSQELHLLSTTEGQRGQTTCSYAGEVGAQIAINGDSFSPLGFQPAGLAMGGATVWAGTGDDGDNGFVRFDRNGDLNGASISPPETVVAAADLPAGTQGVVGGRPMIVRAGVPQTSFDCTDLVALPCERAPRTAVALSDGAATMWLVVVDGWQSGSIGMTAAELGAFVDDLGAHNALMLDSGSSSTLCLDGSPASSPSDGVERSVANHIGVLHGALEPGTLLGFIREEDIFDPARNIEGALVELDDGTSVTTAADARYDFGGITPRYACVTASATGYRTRTLCKQVVSGGMTFNSIALFPETAPIDAGPPAPDAAPGPDAIPGLDAPPATDGGAGTDAGDNGGVDGCGCRTGTGAPGSPDALLLACMALVLLRSSRPRR